MGQGSEEKPWQEATLIAFVGQLCSYTVHFSLFALTLCVSSIANLSTASVLSFVYSFIVGVLHIIGSFLASAPFTFLFYITTTSSAPPFLGGVHPILVPLLIWSKSLTQ